MKNTKERLSTLKELETLLNRSLDNSQVISIRPSYFLGEHAERIDNFILLKVKELLKLNYNGTGLTFDLIAHKGIQQYIPVVRTALIAILQDTWCYYRTLVAELSESIPPQDATILVSENLCYLVCNTPKVYPTKDRAYIVVHGGLTFMSSQITLPTVNTIRFNCTSNVATIIGEL